jgi:hypothetical protein
VHHFNTYFCAGGNTTALLTPRLISVFAILLARLAEGYCPTHTSHCPSTGRRKLLMFWLRKFAA